MRMKLLLLLLISYSIAFSERPHWIGEPPPGYSHDFYIGIGRSTVSESEARNVALVDGLQRIVQSGTITLQASQALNSQTVEKFSDGRSTSLEVIDRVVNDIRIVGESRIVKGLREEEYYTEEHEGIFTVWSLIKIPKKHPVEYSDPTKFSPVWRSVILPSWGQFYKGQPTKGFTIAISIAALVPAGIIFDNLQNTSRIDAKNARTQPWSDFYTKQSNDYKNAELACFAVAGALYIYNVVDAIASSGEKVYVEQDQRALTPYLTYSDKGLDVGVMVRF
jgi:hypothetical protein